MSVQKLMPPSDNTGTLSHAGPGSHDRDAASVRANTYTPPSQAIYYFEVTVVSSGHEGYIGVGMAPMTHLHPFTTLVPSSGAAD